MNQRALKAENGKSRLKANKRWIVAYLVSVFVLCVAGMIPLGYSEQDNEPVSINFASEESKKTIEEVDTRYFSDNYTLTVTDIVQVDSFQIVFSAPNESFKGILTAKLSDEDGEVDRTTVNLASTGPNDSFTVANGVFDMDAQLKKNGPYVLNLQIDTNGAGSFYLQSNDTYGSGGVHYQLTKENETFYQALHIRRSI